VRIGFACHWDPQPETTWSHTPWRLRAALREHAEVVDVGVSLPTPVRVALKAASARRVDGDWVSMWRHSSVAERLLERRLRSGADRSRCDAVLQIADLGSVRQPFVLVQDLSYDVLLQRYDVSWGGVPHFPSLSLRTILRRRDRQLRLYEKASGVIALSGWLAHNLVETSGLPAHKVHIVHPGATAAASGRPLASRSAPRRRLLFIGRDFHTKAGDVVVAAFQVLRNDFDPHTTLTIAGPATWPMPGPIPDGVQFLGSVPVQRVTDLLDDADLFVMPSRFEGFGIAFAEALARGLPCIARDDFAMPELVVPGRNGALVRDDDPRTLAHAIADVLENDQIYARSAAAAAAAAASFTWERAARETVAVMRAAAAVHG
jgi:glycosyltransferase involved in cell wall biosynthesis